MKKLIFLSAATFILASAVNAQTNNAVVKNEIKSDKKQESVLKKEKKEERKAIKKLEGKEVSVMAKQNFKVDFGNIPAKHWRRSHNFDEVTFTKDGKNMIAYYDSDAKLVGTTMNKSFSDLPADAQKEINKRYSGYSKNAVVFFDDNELNDTDMFLYGNQFDDEDSYFVELQKGADKIVLHVNMVGSVEYFSKI
ncbi:MAG: hypothetical protein ABIO77_02480 [Ginsengibacter sp.]